MRLLTDLPWFAVGVLLVLLITVNVYPHGGGLDAYGCHHNRKAGAITAIVGNSQVKPLHPKPTY